MSNIFPSVILNCDLLIFVYSTLGKMQIFHLQQLRLTQDCTQSVNHYSLYNTATGIKQLVQRLQYPTARKSAGR